MIYILVLLGALMGGCLFFPVQLADGNTCLYQYIFDVEYISENDHVITNELIQNLHYHTAGSALDIYLRHYAFIWWICLGLLVFSFYRLRAQKLLKGEN